MACDKGLSVAKPVQKASCRGGTVVQRAVWDFGFYALRGGCQAAWGKLFGHAGVHQVLDYVHLSRQSTRQQYRHAFVGLNLQGCCHIFPLPAALVKYACQCRRSIFGSICGSILTTVLVILLAQALVTISRWRGIFWLTGRTQGRFLPLRLCIACFSKLVSW